MRLLLAIVLAAALVPTPAAAQAPLADTGPAEAIGPTSATLTGTIDPGGAPADYWFEYGTTVLYGTPTATDTVDGDAPVTVRAPIAGLSPSTTYHFRLVTPGGVPGADRTFTTSAAPSVPGIARLAAVDRTPTSARLTARIDPNRAATTYWVEWGTSTRLGNRTPDRTLPAGDVRVPVSVPLTGLTAHTRIYWRVVAANAAGTKRSGTASFTTLRAPAGMTLSLLPEVAVWNEGVSISGRVQGAGVNGLTVALLQATHPFAGFQEVATARTGKRGTFRFPTRPITVLSRFRAVSRTASSVASPTVEARVRPRVGIRRTRRSRRALTLTGRVQPALPAGRATLQRRSPRGGWSLVRRRALRPVDATTSRYGFRVRRLRRAVVYRVKVTPNDGGAHLPGTSRALLVGKRRAR